MNFAELAIKYPPILCRLVATAGKEKDVRVPLTEAEIAQRSGLTAFEVRLMTLQCSWDDIPYAKMLQFQKGCNVLFTDWRNMVYHGKYLDRQSRCNDPWTSLRETKEWLHYWEPLLIRYARSRT